MFITLLVNFFLSLNLITNFFRKFFSSPDSNEKLVVISSHEKRLLQVTNKFKESFNNQTINWNENIDNNLTSDEKGIAEKKWKSRVMTNYTPRGNVLMMYDIYTEAFIYYADNSGIHYSTLNAMAMIYALRFRCRDFFVDEDYIPDENLPSQIVRFHEMERKENDDKTNFVKDLIHENASPFAKLKSRAQSNEISLPTKTTMRNRFIYQGKIRNFDFTQKCGIDKKKFNFKLTYKAHKFQTQLEDSSSCFDDMLF